MFYMILTSGYYFHLTRLSRVGTVLASCVKAEPNPSLRWPRARYLHECKCPGGRPAGCPHLR
jgi:hypothetical protein